MEHRHSLRRFAAAALAFAVPSGLFAATPVARAGDFIDTRLTFTMGDDQILPGEANLRGTLSPTWSFSERDGYRLFFDNLDSRTTGRENQIHVVLYKKVDGYFPGLITEAAGAFEVDMARSGASLDDNGSYLRLEYRFQGVEIPERNFDVTMFPLSSDRLRLGYAFEISWGGDDIFAGADTSDAVPGARVGLHYDRFAAALTFKTAFIQENVEPGIIVADGSRKETNYAAMASFSVDVLESLHLDAGFGYFEQGLIQGGGAAGSPQYTFGGSMQLVLHVGMPVGGSLDLRLVRNDPEYEDRLHAREKYEAGVTSVRVAAEGSYIMQHLGDPNDFGSTVLQPAYAAALTGRLKVGFTRVFLDVYLKSGSFIVLDRPGFVPGLSFFLGDGVDEKPELFASVGADHHLPGPHLTIGVFGGIQFPATVTVDGAGPAGEPATIILRNENDQEPLPIGTAADPIRAVPIFTGKLVVRWDLSDILTVAAIGFAGLDRNLTNRQGFGDLDFINPTVVGGYLTAAARF
ncbi:MAG TPA: hypothetical protein VG389_26855 [Myxococcota bacterium]|nr:hypothetical protein [Myxococcota bacterium]